MSESLKRSTVYFSQDTHRALKMRAALSGRTLSELVNEAVLEMLREDRDDIITANRRLAEPVITYEALLEGLKADGKI